MSEKKKKKSGNIGEDRLIECELMLLSGETPDREKWGCEMRVLAERYPDEFGFLIED